MYWSREEKYFTSLLIWRQNHSKLCEQNSAGSLIVISRKAKFIVGYTNFKSQCQ